jgi:apolipoprotein N-acyltransferase
VTTPTLSRRPVTSSSPPEASPLRSFAAPLLAAAAGLAVLVAHPPTGWWWTSFLAAPLLLGALTAEVAEAEVTGRRPRAVLLGALTGLVAYAPMLSWLIMPAGYVGWGLLVLTQTVWMAVLAWLLARLLASRWLAPAAAIVWTGIDAWRAVLPLNGFEWGALKFAHVDGSWLLPTARLVGGRGITLLTVLIGVAAFVVVRTIWREWRGRGARASEQALRAANPAIAVFVGALLVSVLATVEPPPANDATLDVLVAQGNDLRHWEEPVPADVPLTITTNLRDLTLDAIERDGPPEVTVWPESSVDRDPFTDRGAPLAVLVDEAAEASGRLLSGVSLDGPDPASQRLIAALLFEDGFEPVDRYVKRRLVPFGEFIPLRPLLEWFPPLEQIPRDAVPGAGPQAVTIAEGVEAAVIICFETLFGDIVRSNVLAGDDPAQVVFSLTNDASFGDSAEPAQHLAQSRLRAVETGRWVVHGALSGASAFVDPDGVPSQVTELFSLTTIRMDVPLVSEPTPFLAIGDVLGWLTRTAVLAFAIAALVAGWRRRSRRAGTGPGSSVDGRAGRVAGER